MEILTSNAIYGVDLMHIPNKALAEKFANNLG